MSHQPFKFLGAGGILVGSSFFLQTCLREVLNKIIGSNCVTNFRMTDHTVQSDVTFTATSLILRTWEWRSQSGWERAYHSMRKFTVHFFCFVLQTTIEFELVALSHHGKLAKVWCFDDSYVHTVWYECKEIGMPVYCT